MKAYKTIIRIAITLILTCSFSLSSGLAQVAGQTDTPDDGSSAHQSQPTQQAGLPDDFHLERHAQTGMVRFLASKSGNALIQPTPLRAGATPEEAARNFLNEYSQLFGLKAPREQLSLLRQVNLEDGRNFVRFQQMYQEIPVLGAELIVQLDLAKNVRSVQGETLPDIQLDIQPQIDPENAIQTAKNLIARAYDYPVENLQSSQPELWVYNPKLLGAAGAQTTQLVWRLEISGVQALDIRELVLVDADLGYVVLNFSMIDHLVSRLVYDNENNSTYGLPGNGPVREEGDPLYGQIDVDRAYEYAGNTYEFYSLFHLRDSIDDEGMQMVSTVRYCPTISDCPYQNAFWNGSQMVYGEGYTSADDVVAHELTHGVTQYESGLFYYMQSGAINEALSDIWGEIIDQSYDNSYDNDSLAVRWLIGEDLPGSAIRNMSNPPAFGDPDKMTSPLYMCGTDDSGGVHHNSGVANKAAYLMIDGGDFNGYSISGIGMSKTIRIWYEAQTNLLTSAADYQDLNSALSLACNNLTGLYDISNQDCNEVRKATAAVEMHLQPTSCSATDVMMCTNINSANTFNASASGWTPVSGSWAVDANYYYTEGIANNSFSSTAYTAKSFGDFEYQVRMRRFGNDINSNGVIIRGQPLPMGDSNRWYSGYGFFYSREGSFVVFRYDNGNSVPLYDWEYHPAILTGDAWNEIKIIAQRERLEYYINGALVWSGIDNTYTYGQNGIIMYRSAGSTGDLLQADWTFTNGGTAVSLLRDDFENPVRGMWYSSASIGKNVWRYPQTDIPDYFDISSDFNPTNASSGAYNLWGYNIGSRSDSNIAMLSEVYLPSTPKAFLSFKHTYAFEGTSSYAFDGGVLEYSANGGAWIDAGPLFTHNGYTGILDEFNKEDNPLRGREAFTYLSNGLITSRLDLSSLAGKDVRFRFRIGTDSSVIQPGWFIDDVNIYTCVNQANYNYLPLVITSNSDAITKFHSSFNNFSEPWLPIQGNWTSTEKDYQGEAIISDSWSSISYADESFSNFVYQVRLKRTGCNNCANQILVRGEPFPLTYRKLWDDGYSFSISNSGYFLIFKLQNGDFSVIQDWTSHPAINTGESWNVLKVIAIGSNLQFYINDTLVWNGSTPTFSSGQVGVGFYHNLETWDNLYVDWSQLSSISSLAFDQLEQMEVVQGVVTHGGSMEMSPQ